MPLVFFMAPNDPRMLGTVDAIRRPLDQGGLTADALVYRYDPQIAPDGLPGEEGTFNMCSFWLVEALTRAGQAIPEKLDQARCCSSACWAMPIIWGSTQSKPDRRARLSAISRKHLRILR